ncbi:hypothetical protein LCDVSa031L [Lymphocystis disease virus 3]|uniref:Uncharacterized protein n=1 Tax=Lymphocystis disease virus 3 TaxID=2560566 RepID=A0A1B2RVU9_9VIRU|nr:hypothetical protein BZK12_gp031 [Lymphocystis disease virus Sa]AOC55115.1 hypothetical protein LCDVSa031L [Lymphocystis disease virus 3]
MFLGFISYNQTILTMFVAAGILIEKIPFSDDAKLIVFNKTALFLIDVRSDCNFYEAKRYNLLKFDPLHYDISFLMYSADTQYAETYDLSDTRVILNDVSYYLDSIKGCSVHLIITIASLLSTFLILTCSILTAVLTVKYFYIKHRAALPSASIIVLSDLPPVYEI